MFFDGPRTQILLEASITNDHVPVYTVPAGKKFWLISAGTSTDGGATGSVKGCIHNELDVIQKTIGRMKVGATTLVFPSIPFQPSWPVEMPAGWYLCIHSDAASLEGTLSIFGFEVDA